jgi:hypothetical protein
MTGETEAALDRTEVLALIGRHPDARVYMREYPYLIPGDDDAIAVYCTLEGKAAVLVVFPKGKFEEWKASIESAGRVVAGLIGGH